MAKWNSGPPPGIGWWPASVNRWEDMIRWWDGKVWSEAITSTYTSEEAGAAASKIGEQRGIEWTERPKSWNGKGGA